MNSRTPPVADADTTPLADEEAARLAALHALDLLDTQPEAIFDSLTSLAAELFRTPVALVSLVDTDRQWFKSCLGLDTRETPRDVAFCHYTIQQSEVLVVADALKDPRFARNALVTGQPRIRFYAGAPLFGPEGHKLGSLCIIDFEPRPAFTAEDRTRLEAIAAAVSTAIAMRRDLSAYVALERELHANETRLAFLTNHSADLILRVDPTSRITWASPSARHFGYEPSELVGARSQDLVHPDDLPMLAARRADRFADIADPNGSREYRVKRKDGAWVWVEENPAIVRDEAGRAVELVNILRDISDRKRAEQTAADIQAGMLTPRAALAHLSPRVAVDAVLQPARTVGGDLYDAFMIDERRLCFLLGDVTGKGVPAALFMALSKALSRSVLQRQADDLPGALTAIETELSRNNGQAMAISMLVGVLDLDTGRLSLCNAGLENPLLLATDGTVSDIDLEGGPPLCVADGYVYPMEVRDLPPGATLVALTDGVTEAQNRAGDLFGRPGVRAALEGGAEPVDALVAAVRRFEGEDSDPSDDLTVMALRRVHGAA